MKRFPLAVVFTAILLFGFAQATTNIYVATTGNDTTGDGSQGNPYKTPDRARQAVAALSCGQRPAVVYFASGFYPLSSTWTFGSGDSGCSATESVTYTAQPGDATTPIISGGITLDPANNYTWTNVSGTHQWWVQLSSAQFSGGFSPEALYYNGARRFRARAGATSGSGRTGLYYTVLNQVFACGTGGTSLCYDRFQYAAGGPLDSALTWLNYQPSQPTGQNNPCTPGNANQAGDIEILIFEWWTLSRERISCVDTTNHIAYLEGPTQQNTNHGYMVGHRYVIENIYTGSASLLQGQFFFDRTSYKLYYMAQTGENPNTDTVVIPVLPPGSTTGAVLSASNLKFVTFSNLQFSHDNYAPGSAGFGAIQSNTNLPAMVTCLDCSNTTWSGNTFTQTTGNALWLSTSSTTATPTSNVITGNYLYDLGSDGIVYGNLPRSTDTATNILQSGTITENLVQGYGRMYPGASGIEHAFGSGTTIENNDVTDGYNTGIGVCVPNGNINCGGTGTNGGVASNITGNYNHVWNIGKGVTDDMGAFYIATYQATGNVVNNNRLHDVQDAQTVDSDGYGGNGLYLDNTTGNITAKNNVIYRVTEHVIQNTQGPPGCNQGNIIQNNILAYGRVGMFNEGGVAGIQSCLTETIENNIFYFDRTDSSTCGIGQNSHQCAFYVPSGCTVLDSDPTQAQDWVANLYWNTSLSTWGTTYAKAFFTITSSGNCNSRKYYTFPGWQGLGQDAGSAVFAAAFTNPTCTYSTAALCLSHATQDNFRITGYPAGSQYPISSGNYFTTFCMALSSSPPCTEAPGRLNPTFTPAVVSDTFVTTTFDTTTTSGNF